MLREYYLLTKPGIIRGNILTAITGFLVASRGAIDSERLVALIIGLSLVIAGACVLNNMLDRNIDKKMKRTKKRALVTGRISLQAAGAYALGLLGGGAAILWLYTSFTALLLSIIAVVMYVVVYGFAKRFTKFATSIGSIPGALPPVIGYAATGLSLDIVALGLFLILVIWQMPHFYAIALFRKNEYGKAGISVVAHQLESAVLKQRITNYVVLFSVFVAWFGLVADLSILYFLSMLAVSLMWISKTSKYPDNNDRWGRVMFGTSLLVLLVFCIVVSIDASLISTQNID